MRFAMFALAASIAAGAVAVPGGNARAADISGAYVEDPGICGQPWVLHKITARFRHQVTHVPNLPKVAITNFSGIMSTVIFRPTIPTMRNGRSDGATAAPQSPSPTATAAKSGT